MSKISELSDGGALQSTDYLIAVRSGGNVKVRPNGAVSGTTGQFSTSLNVDGTVTADGLTVDGDSNLGSTTRGVQFTTSGTGSYKMVGGNSAVSAAAFTIDAKAIDTADLYLATGGVNHVKVAQNGDIVFYEDTGTTPKFFWDASAESLGIGTSSPAYPLTVQGLATRAGISDSGAAELWSDTDVGAFVFRTHYGLQERTGMYAIGHYASQGYQPNLVFKTNATARLEIKGSTGETIFNETGGAGADFRVESDSNTNMLFVDAGNNRVGVGTGSPTEDLEVSGANPTIKVTATTDNWAAFDCRAGATQANYIFFRDDTAERARISVLNSEDFYISTGSTPVERLKLYSTAAVFNETGADTDFRVESDTNTHMLFVNAGLNAVGVGISTPSYTFDVAGPARVKDVFYVESTGGANLTQGHIMISSSTVDSPAARGQGVFMFNEGADRTWYSGTGYNAGGDFHIGFADSASATTEGSRTTNSVFSLFSGANGAVFNDNSADRDFRVESDSNTHALFVDAGNDRVEMAVPLAMGATGNGTNAQFFNWKSLTAATAADVFEIDLVSGSFVAYIDVHVSQSSGYAGRTAQYLWYARRATAGNARNVIELTNNSIGTVNAGVVPVATFTVTATNPSGTLERFVFESSGSGELFATIRVIGSFSSTLSAI